MRILPSPRIPIDLIQECLQHLSWRDLLACQFVNKDLYRLIRDSDELQLQIHLGENGIRYSRPLDGNLTSTTSSELQRLRRVAIRLNRLRFGETYGDISTFQLSATKVEDMNLICVSKSYVFVPWTMPGHVESSGIARYNINGLDSPPSLMRFVKPVHRFEVEAAEGVLLVVMAEDLQ